MTELHWADLYLGDKDIPCLIFNSKKELIDHVCVKLTVEDTEIKVYLISIENHEGENSPVFVEENPLNIFHFLVTNTKTPTIFKCFIQEYRSYEEAYKVALDMKECSDLCYDRSL